MLSSSNLHRGNVPLAMRLKIDDLHAHLAPLDHYGFPGLSSAMTNGVRALARLPTAAARGFTGARRGALRCGEA